MPFRLEHITLADRAEHGFSCLLMAGRWRSASGVSLMGVPTRATAGMGPWVICDLRRSP
jgi:hypothetical protein